MKDSDYIQSKINHMKKIMGINAGKNPDTGAAQPDHAKGEAEARHKRHARTKKLKAERNQTFHRKDKYDE